MASLPAPRAGQRHTASESAQQEPEQATSPTSTVPEPTQEEPVQQQEAIVTIPRRPPITHQDTDVKKCWICFADETEDTPETSRWRSPCPCALVAHEECLLDWIADMESPSSRKRTITAPKLLCPQCKAEIHLARPWDPLVEFVKSFERVSTKITFPCLVMTACQTISQAFSVHGVHSIFAIFGEEDARQILDPYLYPSSYHDVWDVRQSLRAVAEHWRLHLGLPLITPMLILSRGSIADSLLPVLPIVFFATQGDANDTPLDALHWPPSASMAMAVLPYIRGAYNAYYRRAWLPHVQRWAREIQPRIAQAADDEQQQEDAAQNENADGGGAQPQRQDGEGVFEIRVDGNLWNDWGEAQEEQEAVVAEEQQGGNVQAEQEQQGQQQAQPQPNRERGLSISTTGLAERVLGALLFPSIAGASGELLRLCLPVKWTRDGATLLGRKWGRSVVGGCLFVVLKDAVMLYVRWKMAQQHRKRKVLDFKGRRRTTA